MAIIPVINSIFSSSVCSKRNTQFHSGQHDQYDSNHSNCQRNRTSQDIRRRYSYRQRRQCHAQRRHQCIRNDILSDRYNQAVQPGSSDTRRWFGGANRHHTHNHYQRYYQFLIGLLAVIFLLPARAQDGGTTAIANPVATSTGSVSNQAVQINQGSYSQQGFGGGHMCNSSTLVVTPFYLGNDVSNPEAPYIRNQNFGIQTSISIPLDFEMVRLCKDLAKRKLEKERLDYELVRILKCVEISKAGYMVHPSSPYAHVCSDVVPIAAVQK